MILLDALFYFARIIIEDDYKFINEDNLHPIIYNLSHSLGSSLSFILIIIYKIRNKRNMNPLLIKPNNMKKTTFFNKILWILLISIVVFISTTLNSIFWINNDNYINIWSFYIIFLSLFSHILLNNKLYKHHYISMIIMIIMGLFYNIISPQINIKKYYAIYIISILNSILYSLEYVLDKYCLLIKYIETFEILFYRGLIVSISLIITLIITTKIGKIDNFWDYYEILGTKEIIIFISLVLINFFYYILFLKIIDVFSPFHIVLVNFIAESLSFFYYIVSYDLLSIIFNIILITIEIFMILIFIEIIELNCLGLSTMIKRNIELRANLEVLKREETDDNSVLSNLTFDEHVQELQNYEKPNEIDGFIY